eukprot:725586-Pelagomonas_calceolata.AAC.5
MRPNGGLCEKWWAFYDLTGLRFCATLASSDFPTANFTSEVGGNITDFWDFGVADWLTPLEVGAIPAPNQFQNLFCFPHTAPHPNLLTPSCREKKGDKTKEGEASMFAPRYRKGVMIGILLFAIQQVSAHTRGISFYRAACDALHTTCARTAPGSSRACVVGV